MNRSIPFKSVLCNHEDCQRVALKFKYLTKRIIKNLRRHNLWCLHHLMIGTFNKYNKTIVDNVFQENPLLKFLKTTKCTSKTGDKI